MKKMTNAQLISALQKLDPNAFPVINIVQTSKAKGVVQLPIATTADRDNYEMWVNSEYSGASITVHLPEGAYIAKLPKEF